MQQRVHFGFGPNLIGGSAPDFAAIAEMGMIVVTPGDVFAVAVKGLHF